VLSIALYILAGFARREARSEESSVKYFLLGSFASGFFLYGTALIYGAVGLAVRANPTMPVATGSFTNFGIIEQVLRGAPDLATQPLFVAGIALIIVGLGFKASIVPFHVWTADVYEGAPTGVTAFMSAGAKVGAFAALIRVFEFLGPSRTGGVTTAGGADAPYQAVLWMLAALTMVVGNVLAIRQTNIKRMLAYSSIAHAGLYPGRRAGRAGDRQPVVARRDPLYLFAYTFMNLGAFAVVIWLRRQGGEFLDLRDYQGLARRHPGAAAAMAVFMLSLAGIPPTAGFFGQTVSVPAGRRFGQHEPDRARGHRPRRQRDRRVLLSAHHRADVLPGPEQDFVGVSPSTGVRVTAAICAIATLVLGVLPFAAWSPNALGENRAAPADSGRHCHRAVSRQCPARRQKRLPTPKNPLAVSQR
jgi:proton-translocating NADH-quinone oxidoreductase chain N